MKAVADLFDRNGEGLIDWQEFIAALRPDWQERKPANDSDKIHDEVKRLVMLCTCRQKFRVFQVGEGKYRVSSKSSVSPGRQLLMCKLTYFSLETPRNCASFVSFAALLWCAWVAAGLPWMNSCRRTILVAVSGPSIHPSLVKTPNLVVLRTHILEICWISSIPHPYQPHKFHTYI